MKIGLFFGSFRSAYKSARVACFKGSRAPRSSVDGVVPHKVLIKPIRSKQMSFTGRK